jgi:hypothetical protein
MLICGGGAKRWWRTEGERKNGHWRDEKNDVVAWELARSSKNMKKYGVEVLVRGIIVTPQSFVAASRLIIILAASYESWISRASNVIRRARVWEGRIAGTIPGQEARRAVHARPGPLFPTLSTFSVYTLTH